MHVLLDARYLDGGYSGIGTYSRLLVESLAAIDTSTRYTVVVRPGFNGRLAVGTNFEVLTHRARPISVGTYFRLGGLYEELAPDIVHALFPAAPVFCDRPLVVTVHDLQPFTDPLFSARRPRLVRAAYNLFYRWAYPQTIGQAKWVLCDSHATRDDVAAFFRGATPKLIVAYPGLDPARRGAPSPEAVEAARAKYDLRGDYLLYYGSTRPNKNLPNLVRAFGKLLDDGQGGERPLTLVLALARDRFFRDVEKAVRRARVEHRVRVLDPLPEGEQRALLSGAAVFCFATKLEGFGFPPLEAMACGTPVLAGDSGSLPEVVGDAALVVDPDDTTSIANGIRRLLEDEDLREDLVARGHERIEAFDWTTTARTVRDVYELLF